MMFSEDLEKFKYCNTSKTITILMSKVARKTKSGNVDKRSETSSKNVSKARATIARYVAAGKRISEEDLVIEESSDEASQEFQGSPELQVSHGSRGSVSPEPRKKRPGAAWELEIKSLRAELALFKEQVQKPAPVRETPYQEHQNTVAAIRRSILLKF
jgi:hypothetical protein